MRKDIIWEYAESKVSKDDVEKIGIQLGFLLPQDYIDCVSVNGGASVSPQEFKVGNVERCFGGLFSFNEESSENIVKMYQLVKERLPKRMLPIADDPAGNLICFDFKDHEDNPSIVFWNHEIVWGIDELMEEENLTEEQAEERVREDISFVADSFTDLINSLYASEEDD
ncbi:SMI1/KNR4 family protein [Bacillus carboniphilus]|uniref:SMI1/KNR4 family protein n=1 Tax=Bacillus carboniphilus TaxID=86663 RepID=A0ABY9JV06_9BACI|nr:SMI1/KNR4 family protein [Bacillus carboniphilus]WLR43226.1 SMI1/KNR4 family protein [Bacillus carboniphilus]